MNKGLFLKSLVFMEDCIVKSQMQYCIDLTSPKVFIIAQLFVLDVYSRFVC